MAETHHVWTEDGYRLELHRVLRKARGKLSKNLSFNGKQDDFNFETKRKPPILVNHGLLSSSADWVLLGPQKALGWFFKYLKNFLITISSDNFIRRS